MFAKPKTKLTHPHDPEITRIYNSLIPKPADLVSVADRRFIREGDLTVYEREKSKHRVCRFFLFNDVMLQTSKESSKKYKLEIFINLRFGLQVGDVPDSTYKIPNVEFRLYTRQKTVFLFAVCEEDKHLWLSDLKQCINGSIDERFPELPKRPADQSAPSSSSTASPSSSSSQYTSSYYGEDVRHEPHQLNSSGEGMDPPSKPIQSIIDVNYNPQPVNNDFLVLSYPPIPPPGQYMSTSPFQSTSAVNPNASSNPFSSGANFVPDSTFWDPTIASEFAQPFVSSTFVPQTTARFDSIGESSSPFLNQPAQNDPSAETPIFDPTTDPNNPFNN